MADADTQSLEEERARGIAELEKSVQRRRLGIRWPTALVAVLLSAGLLWTERRDLAYLLSPREPITLGNEDGYHFDRLISNRYAQIHGVPTAIAAFSREGETVYVAVGVKNTPVIVYRAALPTEDWVPGRQPTRPDQRPFGVRGRLLSREDASRYAAAFDLLDDELSARDGRLWILIEGARPGSDVETIVLSGMLLTFALFNLWLLRRDFAARRRAVA